MARSGRQLSAARSFKTSGTAGSGSTSLSKLSAAHLAAWLRRLLNSSVSRRRRRSTFASRGLRWSVTMTERSSSVSASFLMVAIALGAQVENRRGLCSPFTSTLRMIWAATLVWPESRMPRSSSLFFTNVSASSMRSVGRTASI
jgi:hypothetical protein